MSLAEHAIHPVTLLSRENMLRSEQRESEAEQGYFRKQHHKFGRGRLPKSPCTTSGANSADTSSRVKPTTANHFHHTCPRFSTTLFVGWNLMSNVRVRCHDLTGALEPTKHGLVESAQGPMRSISAPTLGIVCQ